MLDWFNAIFTLLGEFFTMLLKLPFYGAISVGHVLIVISVISVVISVFYARIK